MFQLQKCWLRKPLQYILYAHKINVCKLLYKVKVEWDRQCVSFWRPQVSIKFWVYVNEYDRYLDDFLRSCRRWFCSCIVQNSTFVIVSFPLPHPSISISIQLYLWCLTWDWLHHNTVHRTLCCVYIVLSLNVTSYYYSHQYSIQCVFTAVSVIWLNMIPHGHASGWNPHQEVVHGCLRFCVW